MERGLVLCQDVSESSNSSPCWAKPFIGSAFGGSGPYLALTGASPRWNSRTSCIVFLVGSGTGEIPGTRKLPLLLVRLAKKESTACCTWSDLFAWLHGEGKSDAFVIAMNFMLVSDLPTPFLVVKGSTSVP